MGAQHGILERVSWRVVGANPTLGTSLNYSHDGCDVWINDLLQETQNEEALAFDANFPYILILKVQENMPIIHFIYPFTSFASLAQLVRAFDC